MFLWSWPSVATHVWLFVNAASKLTLTEGGGRGVHVLVPLYLSSGFPGLQMSFCSLWCAPCIGSVVVLRTICLFLCIQITSQHMVAHIDKFHTSSSGTFMELFELNTTRIHPSIDDKLSSSILKGHWGWPPLLVGPSWSFLNWTLLGSILHRWQVELFNSKRSLGMTTSSSGTFMELFKLNTIQIHSSIDDRLSSSILKGCWEWPQIPSH